MDINAALNLARSLMTGHGIGYMKFGFHDHSYGIGTIGKCHYNRTFTDMGVVYLPTRITLNHDWVEVMTTAEAQHVILHEIAHAKAPHGAGHGPAWQDECYKLGIEPKVKYSGLNVPASVRAALYTAAAVA